MTEVEPDKRYCTRCLTTFEGDPTQCPNLSCRRKRPRDSWGRIYRSGEVFDRNYRIHKMLAVGGAGVTYVARELGREGDEVGPRLAVKVLLAARDQGPYVRRLATEAQIIQELDHPNIVQYLGFVHRAGHSPYLITRFEEGGSLLDHMRRVGTLPVKSSAQVGRQICWALEKAHERGIVHRDLKPENVLLARPVTLEQDPVIRVADFGIAKVQGGLAAGLTRVGAFVGTPHYAAPEQFVGGAVSEAADVYSVGALLYFTMMARHVVRFADRLDPEDSFQLLSDNLPPVVVRDDDALADIDRMNAILSVAMSIRPNERCTVMELDAMLEALLADRDPAIPNRQAQPTNDFPAGGASVMGLSAMAGGGDAGPPVAEEPTAATASRAPAPSAADLPPEPASVARPGQGEAETPADSGGGGALLAGAAAAGALAGAAAVAAAAYAGRERQRARGEALREPTGVTLDPAGTIEPTTSGAASAGPDGPTAEAAEPPAATGASTAPFEQSADVEPPRAPSKRPRVGLFLVAVVAVGVLAAAVGAAVGLSQRPDLVAKLQERLGMGSGDQPIVDLPAQGGTSAQRDDHRAISRSLAAKKDQLSRLCGVPAGASMRVRVVVTPSGSVRSASVRGDSTQAACVSDQIEGLTVRRAGEHVVRTDVRLSW